MAYYFSDLNTVEQNTNHDLSLVSSSPLDFIRSIERSNKALVAWQKKSILDRTKFLDACIEAFVALSESWVSALIIDYNLSSDEAKASYEEALQLLKELQTESVTKILSSGSTYQHVVILQDEDRPLAFFILLVLGALIQGNAVYTHRIENLPNLSSCFKNWWIRGQLPDGLFHCFDSIDTPSKEEMIDLMITHPAIRACFLMGEWEPSIKKYSQVLGDKKVFILGEARDVSIVIDLSTIDLEFFRPMRSSYHYRTRPSRVFVLDSCFDEFTSKFQQFLTENPLDKFKSHVRSSEEYNLLKSEEGRVILDAPENSYLVKVDFPNCSILQQQKLLSASVTVTRSKYAHEAIKFSNTTTLGLSGSVWGDSERAKKFVFDLEVCFASINKHFHPSFDLVLHDMKCSTLGMPGKSFWNLFTNRPQLL